MRSPRYWSQRLLNGARKVASGLRPFSESVWPGVRNDLFVAHESLYHFAAQFVSHTAVLDAGCGTGYGSYLFAAKGARSVSAVDLDRHNIRFAQRHYRHPTLTFVRANCEALSLEPSSLGVVYSSNVLEHLNTPERFLSTAYTALAPGGIAVLAVPPITTPAALAEQHGIHFHRSNLSLSDWSALLSRFPWSVTLFHHRFIGADPFPDFDSPFTSHLSISDFTVEEGTLEQAYGSCPITAVFVARRMAA